MEKIHSETWGTGAPVVLVHGSLATGAEEWQAQKPLADEGFRLVALDRRGYGRSPAAEGEDFLRDADDIAELMGDGVHLVGHSYGGLGAMHAAAKHPEATLSLTLLEPAAFTLGLHDPAVRALVEDVRTIWTLDLPDDEWVVRFLKAVGSDALPPELLAAALPLAGVVRHGRPPFHGDLPINELMSARFPKLVVSGGHSTAFDAVCDDLAKRIGGRRAVAAGAGHEVQFAVPAVNELLLGMWTSGTTPRETR
jgi:pimeloyl-ACP methyl ester carboxylesterase